MLSTLIFSLLSTSTLAYNNTVLPQDPNTTLHQQFATVINPVCLFFFFRSRNLAPTTSILNKQHYGLHVFATGANGSLFHMWQTSNVSDTGEASMSKWACLTPDPVYASAGFVPPVWWWDPAAVVNTDGHIDVFIRLLADKNLWQLYQKDPTDPQSFTAPRSPWCLCNFPPCQNQTKCGLEAQCDNKGVDCSTADTSVYWNDHAPFPTSNMNALLDPVTGTVKVIFRGFNGEMYEQYQLIPGNSSKYKGGVVYTGIFE